MLRYPDSRPPGRMMTNIALTALLQLSGHAVQRWIDAGDLVARRFGRQWRICKALPR